MSSDTNEKTDFNFFEKEEIEKMILAPTEERKTFTYNVEYTNPLLEKTTRTIRRSRNLKSIGKTTIIRHRKS
jgi:hypothetical protein